MASLTRSRAFVILEGTAAHQKVQLLSGNALRQGLFGLLRTQVGQQIVHCKHRVASPAANGHIDQIPVLQRHHAPQLQRDGHPLVFPDTAVIVGLEERQLTVLVERIGLQIQPGGVDMRGADVHTLSPGPVFR